MPHIRFLGHACYQITHEDHTVIIDPYLTGNPQAAAKPEDIQVEAVLLTHGHPDHFGDTVAIAQANKALVVANYELAMFTKGEGHENVHTMHIGGQHAFPFGRVKLTLAVHGSAYFRDSGEIIYTGMPCGLILTMGGVNIYHAGDTGLFGDMRMIGDRHPLDVALLPIGDNFTMGIDDAVEAVRLLHPKRVIPMHYNTWPLIEADVEAFATAVERDTDAACTILEPGEMFDVSAVTPGGV